MKTVQGTAPVLHDCRRCASQTGIMHNASRTYTKLYGTDDAVGDFPQGDGVCHHDFDSSCTSVVS